MRALQKTFAEEFERVLVESDTSVRRLARLTGISRRTFENWLYGNTLRPRFIDQILHAARALQLNAVDTDRLLLSAGHPTLTRLRQNKQIQADILLEWQLPPDTKSGQKHSALVHAQQLLKQMSWNEEAHREVMELLALNGRRSEALKQFEVCKQILRDELGVEPSAETLALYERIRRTAHFSHDNIPAIVTPLIGREQELEALSVVLADPNVRLMTITGLGGIGKTRLALDIAWRHTKGQFRDGVTFIPLRALESARRLIPAIAQALRLPLKAVDNDAARIELLDYLQSKQMLLVFDNCEHLLPEMTIVTDILRAAPQTQILATSRERLRLQSEQVFALQGISFNQDEIDHPAAQLFAAAAGRVVPDFEVNQSNTYDVNRLCKMVNGMPLALELAAAWLDTMPTAAIVAEIEKSLDFLTANLSNIAQRHRSLRVIIDSTWEKMEAQTRRVFAALAVFHGSFSRDAAEEVAGASPKLLTRLVGQSLLKFDREADRYELHEMLHQFAAEKLAYSPEVERTVSRQHFDYYNDLAQRGGKAMRGGDQTLWLERLESEQTNIHQAIDWAATHDVEAAARLAVSLHIFWYTRGLNQEATQQCERLITHKEYLSAQVYPWLLAVYAEALVLSGNPNDAVYPAFEALLLFLEGNDHTGLTFGYSLLTTTARRLNDDPNISIQLGNAGLQFMPTNGPDTYYTSILLETLSDSLIRNGCFDEADARTKQGYRLCMQRNDQMCANYLLAEMSSLAIMKDELAEARRYAEKCLVGSRQFKMLVSEHLAIEKLIIVAATEGNFDLAEQYVMDRLILAREANFPFYLAGSLLYMGYINMDQGRYPEALPYLLEAAAMFQKIGDRYFTAGIIQRLSQWVWHETKDGTNPTRWFACAYAQRDNQLNTPVANSSWASFRSDLETSLEEEDFAQAWAEGQKLSIEDVLEEIRLFLPQEPANRQRHLLRSAIR
jgi:predicted ATPase/transcriptional regulator with XRE-family HTH domain